ncbi:SDR family oxidoreductase [Streptomyces sp. 6N223]|uniref:SDR family oxidoreductase n=1 Tax=Streptomyces sp. 6N223 TaxID=3457412 RepID=UPI003FD2E2D5
MSSTDNASEESEESEEGQRGERNARKTIAVAGGTGTLGRRVAAELAARGHEVRVLSRTSGAWRVDLSTGEGLAQALAGCHVVVDASNERSARRARRTLVEGSRRLLDAEWYAGVGHHVCVSVVGCDRVPMGYFRVKHEQERVVEEGPVAWSIVRATQFHELVAERFAAGGRWRVLPLPRARLAPVACAEVARVVAEVAAGEPLGKRREVAGPAVAELRDLARGWRSATGRRALVLPVPFPGRAGRALRAGVATAERPEVWGTTSFAAWLEGREGLPR